MKITIVGMLCPPAGFLDHRHPLSLARLFQKDVFVLRILSENFVIAAQYGLLDPELIFSLVGARSNVRLLRFKHGKIMISEKTPRKLASG